MNARYFTSLTAIILATSSQCVTRSTFNDIFVECFLNNSKIVGSYATPNRGAPRDREGAGSRFAPSPVEREDNATMV